MPKTPKRQDLISHTYNGFEFKQRASDGYVDATALCTANGKLFADYYRLKDTQEFIDELVLTMGIPIVKLIEKKGGRYGGTFVHPLIANDIARWCSAKCAVFVSFLIEAYKQGCLEYKPKKQKPQIPNSIKAPAIEQRKELTDVMKDCGKHGGQITNMTNQIYRGALGGDAKTIKLERGIHEGDNLRDHLSPQERLIVMKAEEVASNLLTEGFKEDGKVSSGAVGKTMREWCKTAREFFSSKPKLLT